MKHQIKLALSLISLSLGANAKTPLQERIEEIYPKRILGYERPDANMVMHFTIVYAKSSFILGGQRVHDFAEYDSTVNEAFLHSLHTNCKDTILTIYPNGRYINSDLEINLDHKVEGSYLPTGEDYYIGKNPLIAIPCGFKHAKSRR